MYFFFFLLILLIISVIAILDCNCGDLGETTFSFMHISLMLSAKCSSLFPWHQKIITVNLSKSEVNFTW